MSYDHRINPLKDIIDDIDCSIYSSDVFYNNELRIEFKKQIDRWRVVLQAIDDELED